MNDTKSPAKSKTLWFNGLSALGAILTTAGGITPPDWAPYLIAAQGIVNIGLRLFTTKPLG